MEKAEALGASDLRTFAREWRFLMKKTMLKRAAAVIAGVSVTASVLVPVYADVRFSDIDEPQYAWAQPYIIDMARQGYITGYEDGTFQPDNEVTRLECLALFSRAMGCNEEVNAPILELAHDEYDSMIRSYSLPWGQDEIVYMLYKGALQKSDLDTYLSGTEKHNAMQRYEAAIIITKAMGSEKAAIADLGVALSYADADTIPANAVQYVQYATDKGIMNGMEDNMFSPNTSVLRSQMAVMLSRTVNKTDYSFVQGRLTAVDTSMRQITIRDTDGYSEKYVYNDDTVMRELGTTVAPKDIATGVQAVITTSGNSLVGVDTISGEPDATITGQYKSMSTTGGIIKVKVIPTGETTSKQYECSADVAITFDGSPATMRSFKDGDSITLEMVGGKAVSMKGETKTITVSGAKVENLDVGEDVTITISHADSDYDGKTYTVSDTVAVTKNSVPSDLRSIYEGDTVTLTIEYGLVKSIKAVSKTAVVEGKIESITISSTPTITVKVNGNEQVYSVTPDVEITINGEEGTLSDFSVGDTVKITTDSNAVKKIVADSTQDLSGTAAGIVTGVNSSYRVITIKKDNGEVMQFQCPDGGKNTTTYITSRGSIKKLKDLENDQSVEIKYTVSNGVYIATLVIILSE